MRCAAHAHARARARDVQRVLPDAGFGIWIQPARGAWLRTPPPQPGLAVQHSRASWARDASRRGSRAGVAGFGWVVLCLSSRRSDTSLSAGLILRARRLYFASRRSATSPESASVTGANLVKQV